MFRAQNLKNNLNSRTAKEIFGCPSKHHQVRHLRWFHWLIPWLMPKRVEGRQRRWSANHSRNLNGNATVAAARHSSVGESAPRCAARESLAPSCATLPPSWRPPHPTPSRPPLRALHPHISTLFVSFERNRNRWYCGLRSSYLNGSICWTLCRRLFAKMPLLGQVWPCMRCVHASTCRIRQVWFSTLFRLNRG